MLDRFLKFIIIYRILSRFYDLRGIHLFYRLTFFIILHLFFVVSEGDEKNEFDYTK